MDNKARLAPDVYVLGDYPPIAHLMTLSHWNRRRQLKQAGFHLYQYKYQPLPQTADDARMSYLRDLLVESRLWLSSPSAFNDPFDMTADVRVVQDETELRRRLERTIGISETLPHERDAALENIMVVPRETILDSAKRAFRTNAEKVGVCSLTLDPRNVLMWSHYGHHHTGLCLQFSAAHDPKFLLVKEVKYSRRYPTYNWPSENEDELIDALTQKFKRWSYEKEWRIIWPYGANTYTLFDASALTGLIVGCRANETSLALLKMLLQEREAQGRPRIRIYRAQLDPSKYALRIRRGFADVDRLNIAT